MLVGCGVWGVGYERLRGPIERIACGYDRIRDVIERITSWIERSWVSIERSPGFIEPRAIRSSAEREMARHIEFVEIRMSCRGLRAVTRLDRADSVWL
ncbi:hypothetical protein CSV76_10850 [Sporosarcina sp. P17b]|nr:hypothetical protein CSV76_10850 [Sporosarcina sp. P17b]